MRSSEAVWRRSRYSERRENPGKTWARLFAGPVLVLGLCWIAETAAWCGQAQGAARDASLPEAPQPESKDKTKAANPCGSWLGILPSLEHKQGSGGGPAAGKGNSSAGSAAADGKAQTDAQKAEQPCSSIPLVNWYARFLTGPQVKPLTPVEKARLAARNVIDPFNLVTILGTSAISVGSDAHSAYGPGMNGFGKYVGVSYAQDMTGEFFGTFLIPSIVHQDPHYHRMPSATMKRRIAHAIYQVVWTQGDDGKEMVNYANLAGYAIDDEIGNLYVPGRETDAKATASRYAIGLATAPLDNFITEFLPDVARHIHVRVVLIQDIINQVAKTGGPNGQ